LSEHLGEKEGNLVDLEENKSKIQT